MRGEMILLNYWRRVAFVQWVARVLGVRKDYLCDSGTGLMMRCVDHIERSMSEHNDGFYLYGEVCRWLSDVGYPGWLDRVRDPRSRYAAGLSDDRTDNLEGVEQELPPSGNAVLRALYADLKDSRPGARILKARGMPLTECSASRVASDSPPLFGPVPAINPRDDTFDPSDRPFPLYNTNIKDNGIPYLEGSL